MKKISEFLKSSKRIFLISKKPTSQEFWLMARIVGIGMLVIGFIGYFIKLIMSYLI